MPFRSIAQEDFMKINHPEIYRRWVKNYGHAKGYRKALSKRRKKKAYGKSKRH